MNIPKKFDEKKFKNVCIGSIDEMKLFVELIDYLRENENFFTKWHNTKLHGLFGVCEFNNEELMDYGNYYTEHFFEKFKGYKFRVVYGRASFYIQFALHRDSEYYESDFYEDIIEDLADNSATELLQEMGVLLIVQQINEFIDAVEFIEQVKDPEYFKNYLKENRY